MLPTLHRWIEAGYIKAIRTVSGKYRISESKVRRILEPSSRETRVDVYTRVSSINQREDFEK
ncbi:MAG: hypothetical protein QXV57_08620 [Thermoproteota archaeon]